METVLFIRSAVLTDSIRREILSVLATSDAMTVPGATAQVAAGWSGRRRRHGEAPSAVENARSIVCQVGADLADELTGQRPPAVAAPRSPGRRRALRIRTERRTVNLRGVVPLPAPRRHATQGPAGLSAFRNAGGKA